MSESLKGIRSAHNRARKIARAGLAPLMEELASNTLQTYSVGIGSLTVYAYLYPDTRRRAKTSKRPFDVGFVDGDSTTTIRGIFDSAKDRISFPREFSHLPNLRDRSHVPSLSPETAEMLQRTAEQAKTIWYSMTKKS